MPAIAAVLMLGGIFLAYAGITGQSPSKELLATLRGQPKPPPAPPLLGQQGTGAAGPTADNLAAGSGAGVSATFMSAPSSGAGPGAVAVAWAKQHLGDPYDSSAAGRMGPRSFDCSGLTFKAWQAAGKTIGTDSYQQVTDGVAVPGNASTWPQAVRPGDLLFRVGDSPARSHGHVTMVVDSGTEIEAPHTGDVVKLHPIPWASIETVRRIA